MKQDEIKKYFVSLKRFVGPLGPALLSHPQATVVLEESLFKSLPPSRCLLCGAGTPGWQLVIPASQLCELTGAVVASLFDHDVFIAK